MFSVSLNTLQLAGLPRRPTFRRGGGFVISCRILRVNQLKDRAQQTPSARIPEFQFLTDNDWLTVAKNNLDTDEDYKRALSNLRNTAETEFINSELQTALKQYAAQYRRG